MKSLEVSVNGPSETGNAAPKLCTCCEVNEVPPYRRRHCSRDCAIRSADLRRRGLAETDPGYRPRQKGIEMRLAELRGVFFYLRRVRGGTDNADEQLFADRALAHLELALKQFNAFRDLRRANRQRRRKGAGQPERVA